MAEVGNECDLGVNFQSNLQFDKHVANACAKAKIIVGIIKHAFSRININMFRLLSRSLIRPIWSSVQAQGAQILNFQLERLNKFCVWLLRW